MQSIKTLTVAAIVALGAVGTAAQAQFARSDSEILAPAPAVQATAGTPLTRAQVIAEREQARRDGTLVTDFVTGQPLFAVDQSAAQRSVATTGKSRAEVRAEVDQARRDGTLVVSDITGRPFYGVAPRASARPSGAE